MMWFRERALRNARRAHDDGYDFAAGMLLRSRGGAQEYLEQHVDEAQTFGSANSFDRGVQEAIADWVVQHPTAVDTPTPGGTVG